MLLDKMNQDLLWTSSVILGQNVNCSNGDNRRRVRFPSSVLMQQAISEGDVQEMKQLVTQYGSGLVNEPEPSGLPPVMRAIFECQLGSLAFLVEAGADLTAQDQEGWSALHVAAAMDDLEAARYIMQRCSCSGAAGGKNLTQLGNGEGERPIDLAESTEMVALLLDADLVLRNDANELALIEIVRRQLEGEGNCTAINQALSRLTPYDSIMHLAADRNYTLLIKYLVECNAVDLNARDRNGWTPLHVAAYGNNTEAVLLTVRSGAALCAVTNAYEKASDLTKHKTIRVLLEGVCI